MTYSRYRLTRVGVNARRSVVVLGIRENERAKKLELAGPNTELKRHTPLVLGVYSMHHQSTDYLVKIRYFIALYISPRSLETPQPSIRFVQPCMGPCRYESGPGQASVSVRYRSSPVRHYSELDAGIK